MIKKILVGIIGLAVLVGMSWGAIENKISVQGRLLGLNDVPLANTGFNGAAFSPQSQPSRVFQVKILVGSTTYGPYSTGAFVTDSNGVFNTDVDVSAVSLSDQAKIQFVVDGVAGAETPLRASPYAIQLTPGNKTITGMLTVNSSGASGGRFVNSNASGTGIYAQGTANAGVFSGNVDVGGRVNATSYYLNGSPLSLGGHWTESGGNVYRSSGKVGIGDTSPDYPLDIPASGTSANFGGTIRLASPPEKASGDSVSTVYWDKTAKTLKVSDRGIFATIEVNDGGLTFAPYAQPDYFLHLKPKLLDGKWLFLMDHALSIDDILVVGKEELTTPPWQMIVGNDFRLKGGTSNFNFTKAGVLTAPSVNATTVNATNLLKNGASVLTSADLTGYALATHAHVAADITSGTFAAARIPDLNASKITAGTMSSARLVGAYTGITGIGTLTGLNIDTGALTAKLLMGNDGLQVDNGNITIDRNLVQANLVIDGPSGGYAYNGIVIKSLGTEKWFMGRNGTGNNENFIVRRNGSSNDLLVSTTTGNVGIGGTTDPAQKLHVVGSVGYTANLIKLSDQRLKSNITPLAGALGSLDKLQAVKFDWNSTAKGLGYSDTKQIGLIAQEVEKVYPELVTTQKDGYKGVDYAAFTPVLIEAVKELKAENDALKARIEKLEAK